MYLCESCGKKFEEFRHYSESHGFDQPPFEEWDGCPYCSESAAVEADRCENCGEIITVSRLFDGLCFDCFRNTVTYESALHYLKENNLLVNFVCFSVWDIETPKKWNEKMDYAADRAFERERLRDKLDGVMVFMNQIRDFICDDLSGAEHYLEWRQKRDKNK